MTISETVTPAQTLTADVTSPIVTDGAQPVVSSPVVDGNPTAPVVDASATPPAAGTTPPGDENTAPATTPKWAQDRINELTAKRYAAERDKTAAEDRARAAEELLSRMGTQPQTPPANGATPPAQVVTNPPPALTDAEIQRRATEMASQMARVDAFNRACNAVAETGEKQFKDWGTALGNLTMVGATGEGANPDFLETAIELKSPEKVLHYLGTNLDQAQRIVALPPKKMALEMARLEAQLNAPVAAPPAPPVSAAPAPILPVGGQAKAPSGDINDPNLSPEEWHNLRNKQIAERRNRYQRVN